MACHKLETTKIAKTQVSHELQLPSPLNEPDMINQYKRSAITTKMATQRAASSLRFAPYPQAR